VVKKKVEMIPLDNRRNWIETNHATFSISEQCRIAQVSRSSFYYQKEADNGKDDEAMKVMGPIYLNDCTLGTRRYVEELKDHGFLLGRDKVRSLMRTMGICAVYRKPRTTVIDPAKYKFPYLLRGYQTSRPNEVWSIDISYIPMKQGFMYLFAIIDVHSRYLVSWSISNSMEAEWVVKTIKSAVKKYGKPQIINSDQGSQFTSDEYVKAIKDMEDVRISMDGKGRAIDNVWIERFFRTIKHEYVYLNPSQDGSELYRSVNTFVNYYNHRRKHSSLGYQTPASVYYGQSDEKWTQGMGNQSTCHRKDIACLHEGQGQALRVATEKIAEKAIFSVQTLTFVPAC
jgi:putative transposase